MSSNHGNIIELINGKLKMLIEKYLNKKNSLRNISDAEFENILSQLASELSRIKIEAEFTNDQLYRDWIDLKKWHTTSDTIASTNRVGLKLCEHFFTNFYDIRDKNGVSFRDLWQPDKLEKVLRWNRKSHSTPYLSELKRGIYFNFGLPKSTMFRPQLAKLLTERYRAKRVLDPCAGWGGRMLGVVSAGAEYVAFEPNTETFNGLLKLAEFLNIQERIRIINDSALNMDMYDLGGTFEMALTSPPYFNLEVYSDEPTQSITGITSYEEWLDKFLEPLILKTHEKLSAESVSCWNVHNVGKMKMIDDVVRIHAKIDCCDYDSIAVVSSKRQMNNTTGKDKNQDITNCFLKGYKKNHKIFF
jgi:16S rRNA G966 N2-methylase RsmD